VRVVTVNYLLKPAADRLLNIVPGKLDKRIGERNPRPGARIEARLFVRLNNHDNSPSIR